MRALRVLLDGQAVRGSSAQQVFEALRKAERVPPEDLGRYLDLIRSRLAVRFGADLDVGIPGTTIATRCEHALRNLIRGGWMRCAAEPSPAESQTRSAMSRTAASTSRHR